VSHSTEMFDVFGVVKGFIKLDNICIDNNVFRLHYKATYVILLTASAMVTAKQYIGDPIDCIVEEIPQNVMDTYCWIHSTFSVPSGEAEAFPHVRPGNENPEEHRYHKYYQWVCFTLFFQALCFYIPRYIWKMWEAGKLKFLVQDLNVPIVEEDTKKERLRVLKDYFIEKKNNNDSYAAKFFFLEILNLVNVIGQIFFVDFFLGGEFTTYGSDVISMSELPADSRDDPMSRIFPKVTKCTFHKYGPSGTVQKMDGLCILPLNIINEKIYVFLWFWFIFLAIVSSIHFVYRLVVIFIPFLREKLLSVRARTVPAYKINDICRNTSRGDWFILYQLGKNIDPIIFREFLIGLHKKMTEDNNVYM